jgi:hypothetical protein
MKKRKKRKKRTGVIGKKRNSNEDSHRIKPYGEVTRTSKKKRTPKKKKEEKKEEW